MTIFQIPRNINRSDSNKIHNNGIFRFIWIVKYIYDLVIVASKYNK